MSGHSLEITMPTVLILGAAGRFGQAAAQAFQRAGWHVLAQVRSAGRAPSGCHEVVLPLADTAAIASAAIGASVVVHGVNPAYHRWDEEALPALHQGLSVARALNARFFLPGNVYGFGSTMPALLREDTPERPDTTKGRIRVAMEDAMRAAAAAGQRCTVIRAGDFFGCGSGSWIDQAVAKDIARGRLVYPGPRNLPHAWAYLPDLAAAFVAVAGRPAAPAFETLHFAGYTLTGDELLAAIEQAAERLGLRPKRGFRVGGLPWTLIGIVGLVHKPWRELARMSYLWRVPHALDGTRLAHAAPLPPATPLVGALTQSLVDLGHATRAPQSALS
jgi:nucleoside-diphosphate-sugar epimerase